MNKEVLKQKQTVPIPHYISNFSVPKLSGEDRTICEGKLSKKECYDALLSLSNNKSPGNDGLSKEFYVCFFNDIHPFLIQALNYSFQHGECLFHKDN